MSLSSALSASVSGLRAQGAAISAVSENIANSSTTAYKTRGISFQSLVTGSSTSSGFSAGGVVFQTFQNVSAQGLIQSIDSGTAMALNGKGFFIVSDDLNNQPSGYTYSRNGNFRPDSQGRLVSNEGYYLLGQLTDNSGTVLAPNATDLNSLVPVDISAISGSAQETTLVRLSLNLPADAPVGATYQTALEVFDALGVSHTIIVDWEKTGVNQWEATYGDPRFTADLTGPASGTIDLDSTAPGIQNTIQVVFNGDGSLASLIPDAQNVNISGFASGSNDIDFRVSQGTVGLTDGLSQYSSSGATPFIDISLIDQNGVRFGGLSDIEITSEGLVIALFDNGLRRPIYQIPVATFFNPNGLTHVNGSIYDENQNAGNLIIRLPGQGDSGTIVAGALELSGTDTSEEFNKMIVAQQAYSSAAQVVSTVDDMFSELLAAVR